MEQSLTAGLLDEMQIHLAPVLLGEGIRLFQDFDAPEIKLETKRVVEAPGITHLWFNLVK